MLFEAYSFNSTAETICSRVEVVEHLVDHGGLKGHLTLLPLILLPLGLRQHDWLTLLTVSDHDLARAAVIWITPL
jgi:hypothetical protein